MPVCFSTPLALVIRSWAHRAADITAVKLSHCLCLCRPAQWSRLRTNRAAKTPRWSDSERIQKCQIITKFNKKKKAQYSWVNQKKDEEEADAAKSSFQVHQVTADGCCGGSGSLNNAGGGLKLKRHWVESPDKQAKSGRIKSVTLFTKPPTAPLELLSAQLQRIFTGKVCSSLFLPVLSKTNVEKAPYLLHKPTMFPYVSCVNNCGCSWQLDLWFTQLCWDRSRCSLCAEQLI